MSEAAVKTKKRKRMIILIVLCAVLIAGVVTGILLFSRYMASSMRVLRIEGHVELRDSNNQEKPITDQLRLQTGNSLSTAEESLASVGLDQHKIITLLETSRAQISKRAKWLQLQLIDGSVFFQVDKSLEDDETFDIRTTTMVVGIRGTSGYVSTDKDGNDTVIVTDGVVHLTARNPVTGEVKEIDVPAGMRVTVYMHYDRDVDTVTFVPDQIMPEDLPMAVLVLITGDPVLLEKVCEDTGWDPDYLLRLVNGGGTPTPPPATPEPVTGSDGSTPGPDGGGDGTDPDSGDDQPGHVHAWTLIASIEPSCTIPGLDTYSCAGCGATRKETVPAKGHSFNEGTVTRAAICTAEGVLTRTCSVCGATEEQTIAVNANNHPGTTVANKINVTCTKDGYTGDTVCSACGVVIEKGTTVAAKGHQWDNGTVTKAAICTSEGVLTRTCSVCKATQEEIIPINSSNHPGTTVTNKINVTCTKDGYTGDTVCSACGAVIEKGTTVAAKGHQWDNGTVTKAAICTSEGVLTRTCSVCKATQEEIIPINSSNHPGTTVTNKIDVSCTKDGYTGDTVCSACGVVIEKGTTVAAKGHQWDNGTVTKAAICTSEGVLTRTCSVCKATQEETIPINANNHPGTTVTNKVAATCTKDGYTGDTVCSACGVVIEKGTTVAAKGHQWDNGTVTRAAICTSEGVLTRTCSVCKATQEETIPINANNHPGTTVINKANATCTKDGYTGDTVCPACGVVIEKGTAIAAKGHQWDNGTVTKAAICTSEGVLTRTCSVCKATQDEIIPINANNHPGTTVINKANATCTKDGYTGDTVCPACGVVIEKGTAIAAKGHQWDEGTVMVTATCVSAGVLTRTCSVCGDTEDQTIGVDADNHPGTAIANETEATCTEDGYTGDTVCSACGALIEAGETIVSKGHQWDGGAITEPATCTTEGVLTRSCSVCGTTEEQTIGTDSTNHPDTMIANEADATCTENGYTGDIVCSACGALIEAGSSIPAEGHQWDGGTVSEAPTCTTEGVRTLSCSVCGTTEDQPIGTDSTNHPDTTVANEAEATCTEDGYTGDTVCSACGALIETGEVIAAEGHQWDGGTVTEEATCVSTGVLTRTCSVCNDTDEEIIGEDPYNHPGTAVANEEEATCTVDGYTGDTVCSACGALIETGASIPANGHQWDGGTVTEEATCVSTGVLTRTCAVCSDTEDEIIGVDANNHPGTTTANEAEATCTEDGYTGDTVCSACGTLIQAGETVYSKGHQWNDGSVTKAATCTAAGVLTRTCSACQATDEQSIPVDPNAHPGTVVENKTDVTCTANGYTGDTVCSACGTLIQAGETVYSKGHQWNDGSVTKAATCMETGVLTRTCSVCQDTTEETVPVDPNAHPGSVVENKTDVTCTANGYTGDTVCTACGTLIEAGETVYSKGHQWNDGSVTKAATCMETGVLTRTCSVCQDTTEETVPVDPNAHPGTTVKNKADPTCTNEGYTGDTVCTACGNTLISGSNIPADGHSWNNGDITQASTCTVQGTMLLTCARCGETEEQSLPLDSQNHPGFTVVDDYDATCTENGYSGTIVCTACSAEISRGNTIPAYGHSWGDPEVLQAATCVAEGLQRVTCDVCGATEDSAIPVDSNAHGPTEVVGASAPGCTTKGATGDTVCTLCRQVLVTSQEIPSAGHQWNNGEVINGQIVYTCDACGETTTQNPHANP